MSGLQVEELMAWKKPRGKDGAFHAYWWEGRGRKRKKRSRALRTSSEHEAERRLRELEAQLDRGAVGLSRVLALAQLKADYLKLLRGEGAAPTYMQRVTIALDHLERLYPRLKVPQISADLLDEYKAKRQAEGVERSTINRELGVIKQAVRKGRRWGYQIQDLSDLGKLKVADKAKSGFAGGEIRALLDAAPERLRLVAMLGLYAGLRRGEMLQLRWADVDLEGAKLVLGDGWKTKTGAVRAVPLHAELAAALRALRRDQRPQERVLGWQATPQALTGAFTVLRRRAGIGRGSIHRLRHTFVTAMANADVEKSKRMRAVGHKSDRTHEGYTHLEVDDLRAAVASVKYDLNAPKLGAKRGSESDESRRSLTVQVGQSEQGTEKA